MYIHVSSCWERSTTTLKHTSREHGHTKALNDLPNQISNSSKGTKPFITETTLTIKTKFIFSNIYKIEAQQEHMIQFITMMNSNYTEQTKTSRLIPNHAQLTLTVAAEH
jgi:hypothetical protein